MLQETEHIQDLGCDSAVSTAPVLIRVLLTPLLQSLCSIISKSKEPERFLNLCASNEVRVSESHLLHIQHFPYLTFKHFDAAVLQK